MSVTGVRHKKMHLNRLSGVGDGGIDGAQRVSLVMEYKVGVTSHVLRIPKVDSDYFDEG